MLQDVVQDLRSLTDSLEVLANAIEDSASMPNEPVKAEALASTPAPPMDASDADASITAFGHRNLCAANPEAAGGFVHDVYLLDLKVCGFPRRPVRGVSACAGGRRQAGVSRR